MTEEKKTLVELLEESNELISYALKRIYAEELKDIDEPLITISDRNYILTYDHIQLIREPEKYIATELENHKSYYASLTGLLDELDQDIADFSSQESMNFRKFELMPQTVGLSVMISKLCVGIPLWMRGKSTKSWFNEAFAYNDKYIRIYGDLKLRTESGIQFVEDAIAKYGDTLPEESKDQLLEWQGLMKDIRFAHQRLEDDYRKLKGFDERMYKLFYPDEDSNE